jgi:pimeloyl-ACP methyl ester carboxylesterase
MTPSEEEQWAGADRFLADACDQRGGAIADHMSTADVARDMDRLRAALGDEQLTYAGVSYGSFLGVTYANMFPDRVRALVVDGVLDPIAWTTGRGGESSTLPFSTRLQSDVGAQATLTELFRLCDAAGADGCALAPGAAQRYAALAARLRAAPVPLVDPETGETFDYTYSFLVGDTLFALYDSSSWPDLTGFLAAVESQPVAAAAGARLRTLRSDAGFIAKRGFPQYPNSLEGFAPVACGDSDNPSSYADWSAAGAAADAAHGYFGRIWTWVSSICAVWPGPSSDRYAGPFNRTTAAPVLVVGNQFDPATPYQGAVTVASLLPGSRLLTVHGWGHTSLFLSACADAAIGHYLVTIQPPPAGTVCEQDVVPFTAGAAAAAARQRSAARTDVLTPYGRSARG